MTDDGGLTARSELRRLRAELDQLKARHTPAQKRRFDAGVYTLQEAALLLTLHLGQGKAWHAALLADLVRDPYRLQLRHPVTFRRLTISEAIDASNAPPPFDEGADEGLLVMRVDVDRWLREQGYPCRWVERRPAPAAPAPAADDYPGQLMRQLLVQRLGSEAAADAYLVAEAGRLQDEQAGPPAINVRRSLYVAKYGGEQAADARLADEARQGARAAIPPPPAEAPPPAPVVEVAEGASASADKGPLVKRRNLIARHRHLWPTVERDLKDASTNGLGQAAKSHGHGVWYEGAALTWARANGKLGQPAERPRLVHRMPR